MTPLKLSWCEIHTAPRHELNIDECLRKRADLSIGECLLTDAEVGPIRDEPWDLTIPLSEGDSVRLRIPRHLTLEQWNQFMLILIAMKPGLVTPE